MGLSSGDHVAGRNFPALNGSLLPKAGCRGRPPTCVEFQLETGAPAGMEREPSRRFAQCAILTESVPKMGVVSNNEPSRIPMVSPFWKFVL